MALSDVASLQQELHELQRAKSEAKQRLDEARGPFGRGRPGFDPRGGGPRGAPGGVFSRLSGMPSGVRPSATAPSSLNGTPEAPTGTGRRTLIMYSDHDDRDGFRSGPRTSYTIRDRSDPLPITHSIEASQPRRRLVSSAVVVADEPMTPAEPDQEGAANDRYQPEDGLAEAEPDGTTPHAGSKRAADSEEPTPGTGQERIRKRNRRMFGALLGTLQKFKDENTQFQSSDVAAKRAEALRKAEEREKEVSERLRRREAEARAARRSEELEKLAGLSLATDTKLVELMYASRIARKEALCKFLCTKLSPPVHWCPGVPNKHTDALFEQQAQALEKWKEELVQSLEAEKQGLVQRSQARREAALARRSARDERMAAARAAGLSERQAARQEAVAAAADRVADEEERLLEAGEFGAAGKEQQQQQQGLGEEGEMEHDGAPAEGQDAVHVESKHRDAGMDLGVVEVDMGDQADKDKDAETVEDLLGS